MFQLYRLFGIDRTKNTVSDVQADSHMVIGILCEQTL